MRRLVFLFAAIIVVLSLTGCADEPDNLTEDLSRSHGGEVMEDGN